MAVWEEEFGVSLDSDGSAKALLQELKSVESPTPSINVPFRQVWSKSPAQSQQTIACPFGHVQWRFSVCPQVLLYSSVHLTRALLSCFLDQDEQLISELWQAVAWLRDTGHFCVSAEFCRLLFPDGTSLCWTFILWDFTGSEAPGSFVEQNVVLNTSNVCFRSD